MTKTALIVDDSTTSRLLVTSILRALGFTTIEALNGLEALGKLDQPLDLVISDVNMPVMDGLTFVSRLREHPRMRSTPVLLLTAEDDGVSERARAAGATGWLKKPFGPAQLKSVVGRVCP